MTKEEAADIEAVLKSRIAEFARADWELSEERRRVSEGQARVAKKEQTFERVARSVGQSMKELDRHTVVWIDVSGQAFIVSWNQENKTAEIEHLPRSALLRS